MKKALIMLVVAFALPIQSNAQFLKKLGKTLGEVGKAVIETAVSDSDNNKSSKKSKSKKQSTDKTNSSASETETDNVDRTFAVQATNYSCFAMLNTADVNLRKEANAKSGKLMVYTSYDEETYEPTCSYFFSDENNGRFRANANAGTTLEAFHLSKSFLAPVVMDMDGWTSLDLSFIIEGIPGVFVSSKFCDPLLVDSLGSTLVCPTYEEVDAGQAGMKLEFKQIYCRTTGKFTDLPFAVSLGESHYNEYGFGLDLLFPIKVNDRYLYVKQCVVMIEISNVSSPSFEWQQAPSMYDDYEGEELHLTMPASSAEKIESDVANIFMNLDEATFTKLIDKIFTYHTVDVSGRNWFKADDGNYYCTPTGVTSPFFVNKTRTVTIGTGKKYSE